MGEKKKKPHHRNVILPDPLDDWVVREAKNQSFNHISEFIRNILRRVMNGELIDKSTFYDEVVCKLDKIMNGKDKE